MAPQIRNPLPAEVCTQPFLQSVRRTSASKTAWPEITPDESASIRQPHWHRRLDVKRPNHGCGATNGAAWFTSVVRRLYDRVDSGTHGYSRYLCGETPQKRTSRQSSERRTRRSAVAQDYLRDGDFTTPTCVNHMSRQLPSSRQTGDKFVGASLRVSRS